MLKWIALMTMIVDHIAYIFIDRISPDIYIFMRIIGRLSLPIFVYYLVLGLNRTSNLKLYMFRLLLFALISELIMRQVDLFQNSYVNILFSLFIYGTAYLILENKLNLNLPFNIISLIMIVFLLQYVEYEYSGFAIFLSLYFINKFNSKDENKKRIYSMIAIIISFLIGISLFNASEISLFAGLSGFLMFRDNLDKRIFSKAIEKWTFYLFYPLQWIVLKIAFIVI